MKRRWLFLHAQTLRLMGLWAAFIAIIVVYIDDASVDWPAHVWWAGLVVLVAVVCVEQACGGKQVDTTEEKKTKTKCIKVGVHPPDNERP